MLSSDNGDFYRAIAGGKSASGQIEFVKRYGSSAPVNVLAPLIDKVCTGALLFSSPKIIFITAVSWHRQPSSRLLSISPAIDPSIRSTIGQSIHPSIDSSIYPSIHRSICHTIDQSIYRFIHLYLLSDWDLEAMIGLHCLWPAVWSHLPAVSYPHFHPFTIVSIPRYTTSTLSFPLILLCLLSTAGNYSEGRSTKHAKWRFIINSSKHLNAIHEIHTADITASYITMGGLWCAVVYMHSFRIRSLLTLLLLEDRQTVFVTPSHTTHIANLDQLFHSHVMSCVSAYRASSQIDFFVFLFLVNSHCQVI